MKSKTILKHDGPSVHLPVDKARTLAELKRVITALQRNASHANRARETATQLHGRYRAITARQVTLIEREADSVCAATQRLVDAISALPPAVRALSTQPRAAERPKKKRRASTKKRGA